jgi:hypothetical protein
MVAKTWTRRLGREGSLEHVSIALASMMGYRLDRKSRNRVSARRQ